MKLRIHDIRKEACRLLSSYFGLRVESAPTKSENKSNVPSLQTPDFYNSRMNNSTRKNLSTKRRPE
jgi:hypothetical protein